MYCHIDLFINDDKKLPVATVVGRPVSPELFFTPSLSPSSLSPLLIILVSSTRGASDEGEIPAVTGRRSTQSTPKAGRTRLHSAGDTHAVVIHSSQQPPGQQTYGSLGSMEPHLVVQRRPPRDRSWESERTHNCAPAPRGLNRMWEVERRRGMELLQQSVEREKVRRGQKSGVVSAGGREKRRRQKKRVVKPAELSREPVMHVDTVRVSCLIYLLNIAVSGVSF